jgi:nucleoside phosphorylase
MINLVVALPAEARPLIECYRLTGKTILGDFRIYRHADISLIISGPGKVASAAATALLGSGSTPGKRAAWLNIGIAGHASDPVGEYLLAHRITDLATGHSWYPPQLFDPAVKTTHLITVDAAENSYQRAAAYDMEASGFYPVASRFSSTELVQCVKIVSDNREHSTATVTAAACNRLVTERLHDIDRQVSALRALAHDYNAWHAAHTQLEQLASQWHFTVSQRHQLTELARRWKVLLPHQPLWLDGLEKKRKAAAVLQCLQQHLDSLPPLLARKSSETGV